MVRFINCFEVPIGREEAFLSLWRQVNAHMAGQPGYVGHELHRSLGTDARYRFVNYARWASVEDWERAHDAEFRRLVGQSEWQEFTTTPALYEVVHQGQAPVPAAAAAEG